MSSASSSSPSRPASPPRAEAAAPPGSAARKGMSPSYALGLLFIGIVSLLWAGSSVLTQYLYTDRSFDSPFLLTYIGVSLFTLWLPGQLASTWIRDSGWCFGGSGNKNVGGAVEGGRQSGGNSNSSQPASRSAFSSAGGEVDEAAAAITELEEMGRVPSTTFGPEEEEEARHNNPHHHHVLLNEHHDHHHHCWTHRDHVRAALLISPVWFIANWTYNASLAYTSITSSTVLASTGSLFTFLFATCSHNENYSWLKLAGVVLGVVGSCATALSDASEAGGEGDADEDPGRRRLVLLLRLLGQLSSSDPSPSENAGGGEGGDGTSSGDIGSDNSLPMSLWGDALGLIGAIGYGGYAVLTRVLCPHDEKLYSMQLLLGYIGLICMVLLSPVAMYQLLFSSSSSDDGLTWVVFGFLVLKGLFDNVISDYLWLRAVILTSATVATVGVGLTIPLAFLSDLLLGKDGVVSFGSVCGAVSILAGFVLVNVGNEEEVEDGCDSIDDGENEMLMAPVGRENDDDEQTEDAISSQKLFPHE